MSNSITPQKNELQQKNIQIPFNPSLAGLLIRQAKPFGFACFFIRNSLLHLIYFKKFSKNNDKTKKISFGFIQN